MPLERPTLAQDARYGSWLSPPTETPAKPLRASQGRLKGYSPKKAGSTDGRPAKWCGWYMRTLYGGGPEYNVAWNWSKRGVATSPQIGAIVVWRHHVGYISGQRNGKWVVTAGNSCGGRVCSYTPSLKGAVFRSV